MRGGGESEFSVRDRQEDILYGYGAAPTIATTMANPIQHDPDKFPS